MFHVDLHCLTINEANFYRLGFWSAARTCHQPRYRCTLESRYNTVEYNTMAV